MNVLMIPCTNSGVTYFRMFNFAQAAHRTGAADMHVLWWQKELSEWHPWQWECNQLVTRYTITGELDAWGQKADVIICQMVHTPAALELIRALKDRFPDKPILAEIDDNMRSLPGYNEAEKFFQPGSKFRDIALAQFREADAMIVSTPYLRDEIYADLNPNIYVVPNSVDFNVWDKVKPRSRNGIRIIYTAGGNHDEDLKLLENVIPGVVSRHPEAKFVFFHYAPESIRNLPGVEILGKWARIDKYPKAIAELGGDIGIAPLVDNSFNRAKSNLRWLDYSALKIPTVASRVGHFAETIKDGYDGFLADDPKHFEACLEILIKDKVTRKGMGLRAYDRVRAEFNVDSTVKGYVDILKEILERGVVNHPKTPPLDDGYKVQGIVPAGVPIDENGQEIPQ